MHPREFAFYGGIVMVVVALLAMVAPGSAAMLPPLNLETSYGLFLGLIPMNIVNKLAILLFGVAGIVCSRVPNRELPTSIWYARVTMVAMAVLAVLGLFPQTDTLGGYWPLFGNNVGLYALVAVISGYFGFALSSKVNVDRVGPHPSRESLAH